jgi:rod shape-determining protein MreC
VRNFILFVRRFFNLILFIGLEIVCFILIARTNMMQGNEVMNSANAVSGLMYKKQNDVVYYFGLRTMNDSLLNENARLRAQLAQFAEVDTLNDTLVRKSIPKKVNDSTNIIQFADYYYRTARVINNSVGASDNYITINRGRDHGIREKMAVVSGNGVVGKIISVSDNFSVALSVLSMKQQVSAKLKDGTLGFVTWEGGNPDVLFMRDVPAEIKVKKGDSVMTTSYSFFPQDVLIGRVFKVVKIKKNNLQLLYLRSSTNFRKLQYVYVVENKMTEERTELEDSTKGNK